MKITILITCLTLVNDNGAFYGPQGDFLGSYQQHQGNTQFYDSSGVYTGRTVEGDGSIAIYGPEGEYRGRATTHTQPRFHHGLDSFPKQPQY